MRPPDLSEEIERLVERGARDPRTHTFARLADLYRKVGEMDRALEVIEAGLKHHPHYLNARLVHARLLRDLGRSDEAVVAFERVLEIDSENRVARAALDELTGPRAEEPAGDAGERSASEPAPERSTIAPSAGWLARLDADWRHAVVENGVEGPSSAADGGPTGPEDAEREPPATGPDSAPDGGAEVAVPGVSAVRDAATPRDDVTPRPPSAERELETATLARLYVSQGLHDQAVAIYERLLARDPYNARLAAALEEARRGGPARGDAGRSTPSGRGDAARPAVRDIPPAASTALPVRPEMGDESVAPRQGATTAEPSGEPIGPFLQQLLEGRAPIDGQAGTARRWPDWLRKIGVAG